MQRCSMLLYCRSRGTAVLDWKKAEHATVQWTRQRSPVRLLAHSQTIVLRVVRYDRTQEPLQLRAFTLARCMLDHCTTLQCRAVAAPCRRTSCVVQQRCVHRRGVFDPGISERLRSAESRPYTITQSQSVQRSSHITAAIPHLRGLRDTETGPRRPAG